MHPGAVNEILRTLLEILAGIIFNRVYLREHIEHIETETVHTLVQPEVQDGDDLFPDLGILPVEIGLFHAEQMQIEFKRH